MLVIHRDKMNISSSTLSDILVKNTTDLVQNLKQRYKANTILCISLRDITFYCNLTKSCIISHKITKNNQSCGK
ncbi:hypothetical protein BpHYR1_031124 [Brachionus plicatilis]|uniref:Uncharacterized protein n=1 Tax=Brachionus plicatilis TaxID=10195 RepID=A0A3M7P7G0_BRAPC|nr:hypothetical protein BpHYR1_031124 [Brachionus plicatilis]